MKKARYCRYCGRKITKRNPVRMKNYCKYCVENLHMGNKVHQKNL